MNTTTDPESTTPSEWNEWYTAEIEEPIRPAVKLLRDNGFNTVCSCGHDMMVQCDLYPDGSLQRLHHLLFAAGYKDYTAQAGISVEGGAPVGNGWVNVRLGPPSEMRRAEPVDLLCMVKELMVVALDWEAAARVRDLADWLKQRKAKASACAQ